MSLVEQIPQEASATAEMAATPTFESMLERAQRDEELAGSSASLRAAEAETGPLEAEQAQPGGVRSTRRISADAVALIIAFEVTSRAFYDRRLRAPIWPQGGSGVTIGIGYDMGFVDQARLGEDWTGELDATRLRRLGPACGITGPAAGALVGGLGDVQVAWEEAEAVFRDRTLPLYTGMTERALPNTAALNGDCLGALVSLVYNRGPSFGRDGERFREMRAIRQHMQRRDFGAIPAEIRAMRRIWQGQPGMAGLLRRREAEAALFERGLESLARTGPTEAAPAEVEGLGATLRGWLGSVVEEPTRDHVFAAIEPPAGMTAGEELAVDAAYVALRVLSARIGTARRWTSRYHAAVHARCDMIYYGAEGRIAREVVLAPDGFRDLDPDGQGKLLQMDRPLFGPAPYRGDLRLSLGLFAVKSSDLAGPYLTLLGQLAETGALGFLRATEPFVAPLRSAAELLFGTSGAASLQCGVVRGFQPLRSGVWACLGAPRDEVGQRTGLRLDPDDFRLLWPDGRAVTEHPYVVFSIEGRARRDDWMAIPDLREAWEALRSNLAQGGTEEATRTLLDAFRRRCLSSPDLLPADARELAKRAEAHFGAAATESARPHLPGFADLDLYGRRE